MPTQARGGLSYESFKWNNQEGKKSKGTENKINIIKPDKEFEPENRYSKMQLSVPWSNDVAPSNGAQYYCEANNADTFSIKFVEERSKVHDTYLREYNKTKRIGIITSAIMLVISGIIVLFAPSGRENLSYLIGLFLVITSAGIAGLTALKIRFPGFSLNAKKKSE